ncbi:hypothetical protein ACFC1W_06925 [Microbacterium sp. NPDC056003]|uniref:hypothetical protein n=1 Tax=Microbacterium sp. NPDC056003 TaxID=3345676 RepID=UPI0035DFB1B7
MTPSLKRLQSFADIAIVIGPLLLVLGLTFAYSVAGLMLLLGTAAAVIGGILLLAGLVSRAIELGVRAMHESASLPATDDLAAHAEHSSTD